MKRSVIREHFIRW